MRTYHIMNGLQNKHEVQLIITSLLIIRQPRALGLALLILPDQQRRKSAHEHEPEDREDQTGSDTRPVAGRLALEEDLRGDEVGAVAEAAHPGHADGEVGAAAQVGRQPAEQDGHLREGAGGHEEEGRVAHAGVRHVDALDDPADQLQADGEQQEGGAQVEARGQPRQREGEDDAGGPDGHGHQLRDGARPAELGEDGGREGGDGRGGEVAADEAHGGQVDAPVDQDFPDGHAVGRGAFGLSATRLLQV